MPGVLLESSNTLSAVIVSSIVVLFVLFVEVLRTEMNMLGVRGGTGGGSLSSESESFSSFFFFSLDFLGGLLS